MNSAHLLSRLNSLTDQELEAAVWLWWKCLAFLATVTGAVWAGL